MRIRFLHVHRMVTGLLKGWLGVGNRNSMVGGRCKQNLEHHEIYSAMWYTFNNCVDNS